MNQLIFLSEEKGMKSPIIKIYFYGGEVFLTVLKQD